MNWFYDTFLPSLLERAGTNKAMWLTQKQTAICIDRMKRNTVIIPCGQGSSYYHDNYSLDWAGRHVRLCYSKKNGCGTITFGFTAEEAAEDNRRYEEEKRQEAVDRMERKRKWAVWARENDPEKLTERIRRNRARISELCEALDDIRDALAEWESEGNVRMMKREQDALKCAEKELAEAEAILAIYL